MSFFILVQTKILSTCNFTIVISIFLIEILFSKLIVIINLFLSLLSFYETGFYQHGKQLSVFYFQQNGVALLRKLYREGAIDGDKAPPLTLSELKIPFLIILCALLLAYILFVEIIAVWTQI